MSPLRFDLTTKASPEPFWVVTHDGWSDPEAFDPYAQSTLA